MSSFAMSTLRFAALTVAGLFILTAAGAVSASHEGRAAKTNRLEIKVGSQNHCSGQTWPNIAADCLERSASAGAKVKAVRYITVDRVIAPNTTVLTRIPAMQSASAE